MRAGIAGMLGVLAICLAAAVLVGCGNTGRVARGAAVPLGDAQSGRAAIQSYGCGACHTVPGVPNADASVGPPLTKFGDRSFIAGKLANTPDNLVTWVMLPQQVEPGTAMPDLGVTREDAQNIAAYLERLH
jgi:cytochrome c2